MDLKEFFKEYPDIAVAFSGGVDSAYLLYAARQYGKKVCAYYVKSQFQPRFELKDAITLAKELDVDLRIINVDILSNEKVAENPKNRCYFCKRQIFETIIKEATKDGFNILIDGTNVSDDVDDRPGMLALQELKVLSPLRICGLTKQNIRDLSKEAGLFTWDKPAYACLATRINTGNKINEELLKRTEDAEAFLHSLGFKDFRVRTLGNSAKIQVRECQLELLLRCRKEILLNLGTKYDSVMLDLEVRNE